MKRKLGKKSRNSEQYGVVKKNAFDVERFIRTTGLSQAKAGESRPIGDTIADIK